MRQQHIVAGGHEHVVFREIDQMLEPGRAGARAALQRHDGFIGCRAGATGLGNQRYLKQKLADSIRQVESRGGAVCYMLIGLPELAELGHKHGQSFQNELLHGVARRLQQLVRPLDVLARIDDQHFALITLLDNLQECSPGSFKRLHEGLNLKAFKTSEGFITLKAGISLVALDAKGLPIDGEQIMAHALRQLPSAYVSGRVAPLRLPLSHAEQA